MQVLTSTHRQNTSLTACSSGNVCCFKLESQLGHHLHFLLLCMQNRLALLVLLNISRSGCHVVVICRVTVERILRPTNTHLSVLSLHLFFVCPCLSFFPLFSLSAHQLPVLDYTFPTLLCHSFCSYFLFSFLHHCVHTPILPSFLPKGSHSRYHTEHAGMAGYSLAN